jgi:hypothetical protein
MKDKQAKHGNKRSPRKYENKAEICDMVLSGMRSGLSAFKACEAAGVPHSTFMEWLKADADLADRYARAREDLIERMANETMAIADQAFTEIEEQELNANGEPVVVKRKIAMDVQRSKLQVDTRKWLLSKLAPKKYGERLEIAGDKENPLHMKQTFDASKLPTEVLAQIMAAKDHQADAS